MSHTHLHDWYRICARMQEQLKHELTMRQWLILMHIYLVDDVHSVKSLAYSFDISKPAICRALDSLSIAGLVRRRKDENDKRNVTIQKTMQGIAFLNQFSDILEHYHTQNTEKQAS